jgi:hypothetical protein
VFNAPQPWRIVSVKIAEDFKGTDFESDSSRILSPQDDAVLGTKGRTKTCDVQPNDGSRFRGDLPHLTNLPLTDAALLNVEHFWR